MDERRALVAGGRGMQEWMPEHEHYADMRTLELLYREVDETRYRAACRVEGCGAYLHGTLEEDDVDTFGDWSDGRAAPREARP